MYPFNQDFRSSFMVNENRYVQPQETQGFKILCENTAPSALYGHGHSFTGPQCHPRTRIAVQDYIFRWLEDPDGPIAMWMNGPVGIGKSAIAQTIAHHAAERRQLSSAIFFFRFDNTRNNAKHLVPTLAYEMTQQLPSTFDPVCRTITTRPLIFSSTLDRQIHEILLQPLHLHNSWAPEGPRLIIIDGLDECLDTNVQQGIIRSFITSLLSVSSYIIPHKLLIVSRPELHISSAFSASSIRAHVEHLPLGLCETEDDIGQFLHDKLKEIKDTHPMRYLLPDIWPNEDSFRKLHKYSVGSFAYASAVIRILMSHKHNPNRALQDILSFQPLQSAAAFVELDALYRHILSSLDPDICFTLQRVLCLYLYSSRGDVTFLASGLSEELSVVEIALIHVPSLINFDGRYIELYHSSFEAFLRDKERSADYHIFSHNVSSAVATALSTLWLNTICDRDEVSWFSIMSEGISNANADLTTHILRALLATKISASILTVNQYGSPEAIRAVTAFFAAIQQGCARYSGSTHGSLYSEALNVVCLWLRLQFNDLFQGHAPLSDILDILLKEYDGTVPQGYNVLNVFYGFARNRRVAFDLLCRLIPETDRAGVCSGIVGKYLAVPSSLRQIDASRKYRPRYFTTSLNPVTLIDLYLFVLDCQDTMSPDLCHCLERLVSDGQTTLGAMPSQYRTSKHCIFRNLYGEACNIGGGGELHINNGNYVDSEPVWRDLVEKTDNYIRQVHAKLDFPYISKDVEALYTV